MVQIEKQSSAELTIEKINKNVEICFEADEEGSVYGLPEVQRDWKDQDEENETQFILRK